MIQAMAYSATLDYLKALKSLNTDDNAQVAAWLHEHLVDDVITHMAPVRPDGRVMNDLYVVRAKAPADISDPLDNLEVVREVIAAFDRTIASAPQSAFAYLNRGLAWRRSGDLPARSRPGWR